MLTEKSPDKNSAIFVWFNNYAGVFLKTQTKTLVIDPVDVRARDFGHLDAVLITHEHYDHLDQRLVSEIQKLSQCDIIADQTSARSLRLVVPAEKLFEVREGDKTKIGEVGIAVQKCKHPAATPVTYVITTEDGLRIWHTADSSPFPEMAQIAKLESLDVVFCTVGIAPGASPQSGSEIAWLTKPKVAVPYHCNSAENQREFAQILKKELPKTTVVIPQLGKGYQVSKGEVKT